MSISFNHPSNTMTSTDSLTLSVSGGSVSNPKPIRLNAISAVMPKSQQPAGEQGAMYFDITSGTMKYHNGTAWIEWLDSTTMLAPIRNDLADIIKKLGTKIDSVTYSSSAIPAASISGTNLNIVFPTGQTTTGTAGLFTSLPAGSIAHYSLLSGQTMASVREQMSGVANGQAGRNGTAGAPYISKTGWCLADGNYWTWQGASGTVTKQVPALNNTAAYLKSTGSDGITKTDTAIAASGTITSTSLSIDQLPPHSFTVSGTTSLGGDHAHGLANMWTARMSIDDVRVGVFRDGYSSYNATTSTGGAHQHSVSGNTNTLGAGAGHAHGLNAVDVAHFNVAILYNIAEPAIALSQTAGDARYVLKAGDTMTGALNVASSLTVRDDQTNLVFWLRNSAGTERAAIYHNASSNSLRLRSSGGAEVVISNSGELSASSLTAPNVSGTNISGTNVSASSGLSGGSLNISGSSATVAGRNVVRSINGSTADASGNVTLNLTAVTDVRLGSVISLTTRNTATPPDGYVITGTHSNYNDKNWELDTIYCRPLQKQVGGVWYTVGVI